jgi:transposase InsO family protein
MNRLANCTRHRQTGNRHRLASSRLPFVLDVEKSPAHRSAGRRGRSPRIDSEHVGEQLTLGRAQDSRRVVEIRPRRLSSDGREVHASAHQTAVSDVAHVPDESRPAIAAADFFVVPTARCRLLFVLLILAHERRRVVHIAVTDHPTAAWTAQPLREAFPWDEAPRYLVHDRDTAFHAWATTATSIGIAEIVTAVRSPWQNAYAERLIGSIRRECLDHIIISNERGLRRVLNAYVEYYLKSRTHLSLSKDAPVSRPVKSQNDGEIVEIPLLSGLHHRYERRAA